MRKKVKRILFRATLTGVLLVIVVGVLLYLNLNRIVRRRIETQATQSMNLATTVRSASLAPFGGKLHVDDFRIASPPGFSSEPFLTLGGGDMVVSYGELRGDPVHIHSITFTRPRLLIEGVNLKFNFKAMAEQMPPPSPHPMRLVIDEVTVEDATVVLRPGLPGLPREMTVQAATFKLHDIGKGDGENKGVLVKEVIMQLVTALAAQASDSEELPPQLRRILKGDVNAVLAGFGEEARRKIIKAVPGDMGKTLGDLFRPRTTTKSTTRLFDGFPVLGPASRPTTQPAE